MMVAMTSWRADVASEPLVVVPLLGALVVCLVLAASGGRRAAAALVPLGVAWLTFNGRLEGPVLVSLNERHGLTLSDVLALLGFAIAARAFLRRRPDPVQG
jgi:hypothetical protein